MKRGYTIQLERWHDGIGILTYTLANDDQFYQAVKEPLICRSVEHAQRHWYSKNIPFKGMDRVYIRGPRGKAYRMRRYI